VYELALLAALPAQFVDAAAFPKDLQRTVLAATVRVRHPASRAHGSAVAVARRGDDVYFLTAAHLVEPRQVRPEDVKAVELNFYTVDADQKLRASDVPGRVVARMPNEDLAVFVARLPEQKAVVPICPKEKARFDFPMTVLTVGAALDGPPELKIDRVTRKRLVRKPDGTAALYWEADVPQPQGRSGGGMIDARGYLIGIASGTERKKGYYAYIDEIHQALTRAGLAWLVDEGGAKK